MINASAATADTVSTKSSESVAANIAQIKLYNPDDKIMLIAVALGIAIILIGYFFAGGKNNKAAVVFSISVSTVVGILTLPLIFQLGNSLNLMDRPAAVTFLILLDFVFIATVSALAYEIVTVTAREARPPD